MNRIALLAALALPAAAAYGLYEVKYAVQHQEQVLRGLNQTLIKDQEAIHVLEAEWSYLVRPSRLQRLVEKHLNLTTLSARQVGEIANLPMRKVSRLASSTPGPVNPANPALTPVSYGDSE